MDGLQLIIQGGNINWNFTNGNAERSCAHVSFKFIGCEAGMRKWKLNEASSYISNLLHNI